MLNRNNVRVKVEDDAEEEKAVLDPSFEVEESRFGAVSPDEECAVCFD